MSGTVGWFVAEPGGPQPLTLMYPTGEVTWYGVRDRRGGLAGAKAAETLRAEGYDGEVVLVSAEAERPYERPPLSKGYLLGSDERDSAFVHPKAWYDEHDVSCGCPPARRHWTQMRTRWSSAMVSGCSTRNCS